MKIKNISLRNYKRFLEPTQFSFCNTDGEINDVTLIVGPNGCGKSTVLQSIVSLLATAIRDNFTPNSLDWPGYEYRFLQTGQMPLRLDAEIRFSKEEIDSTYEYAQKLQNLGVELNLPSKHTNITLSLDFEHEKVFTRGNAQTYYQFSGYQYAKRLSSISKSNNQLFENIGNIYWYNEYRNAYSFSRIMEQEAPQIDFIRIFLANAYAFHQALLDNKIQLKEGQFDFYDKIKSLYKTVFPNRSFVGPAPRFDVFESAQAPDFFLYDGKNQYEISGMSAGERAIFPILMDFARWNINNSIIIIDEIELHLHPPLQQAFVRALSKLGKNNQFIISSHSNTVAALFDETENQIIRLG